MYSLIVTAKMNGVDPQAWLADVLSRIAAHPAHLHPDEEIVIVKEGVMEATFGGRSQAAEAGSIFFFASNDLHGMRNAANARASYYVIRMITAATPKVGAK